MKQVKKLVKRLGKNLINASFIVWLQIMEPIRAVPKLTQVNIFGKGLI